MIKAPWTAALAAAVLASAATGCGQQETAANTVTGTLGIQDEAVGTVTLAAPDEMQRLAGTLATTFQQDNPNANVSVGRDRQRTVIGQLCGAQVDTILLPSRADVNTAECRRAGVTPAAYPATGDGAVLYVRERSASTNDVVRIFAEHVLDETRNIAEQAGVAPVDDAERREALQRLGEGG